MLESGHDAWVMTGLRTRYNNKLGAITRHALDGLAYMYLSMVTQQLSEQRTCRPSLYYWV